MCVAAGGAADNSTGPLGVKKSAGWFKTMFPNVAALKGKTRVQFLPANVVSAVEKAIKQSTVDLTLDVSGLRVEG
jgi:hypothetical protein